MSQIPNLAPYHYHPHRNHHHHCHIFRFWQWPCNPLSLAFTQKLHRHNCSIPNSILSCGPGENAQTLVTRLARVAFKIALSFQNQQGFVIHGRSALSASASLSSAITFRIESAQPAASTQHKYFGWPHQMFFKAPSSQHVQSITIIMSIAFTDF